MTLGSKAFALKLARSCRRFLPDYATYRSVGTVQALSPDIYQFTILGRSKKPAADGESLALSYARAYVTVYSNLDVHLDYDEFFPTELFDCIKRIQKQ